MNSLGVQLLPKSLIVASASIVLVLGSIHLVYTFASNKFSPRDAGLEDEMKRVSPVISKQTTMWNAWVGFNASHSLGAMLFGSVYAYLAAFQFQVLLQSRFLITLGALFLLSFLLLAKRHWFNIPLIGLTLSVILYAAGFTVALA